MSKPTETLRPSVAVLTLVVLALLLLPGSPAQGDDRDLLRFDSANPYLFILLDSSGSMTLQFGADDLPTVGHGDDPASRIYAAKAALFEVFKDIDDVNFGFASFNSDRLRVRAKHWVYYHDGTLPVGWPLGWPNPDLDGLTEYKVDKDTDDPPDGIPDVADNILDNDVEPGVDILVLGHHIDAAPMGTAGTCASPLDLDDDTDRAKANAFPKLHTPANPQTTTLWLEESGITYRLQLSRAATNPDSTPQLAQIGDPSLYVDVVLEPVLSCSAPVVFGPAVTGKAELKLDPNLNEFLMIDNGVPGGGNGNNATEETVALWPWEDAQGTQTCGSSTPFSGKGWEGNYDGGPLSSADPAFDTTLGGNVTDVDEFCTLGPPACLDLHDNATVASDISRTLDRGDLIPFDWTSSNKTAFLQRLAPNYPFGPPDFRVSPHLQENLATGLFEPVGRHPIVARGDTPLAKSVNDFRCWYRGEGNKCKDNAFYNEGWEDVACAYDSRWGCRKPFLIVISDGKDTCAGENAAADTANLFTKAGVRTWAVNLGDPQNCQGGGGSLKSMTSNGKGECVNVANKEELVETLQNILGQILEETRAFASAAVPSVQATADQSLYHTNFTPLRNRSVWDGHVNAFLKPLPVDSSGMPDISGASDCPAPPAPQSGCRLWDAGEVLLTQANRPGAPLGNSEDQRRVYYSRRTSSGKWNTTRRFFSPTTDSTNQAVRYDLWRGLGVIAPDVDDGTLNAAQEDAAQTAANAIIATTLAKKTATVDSVTFDYVLGDIFHADPVVIGSPSNNFAFITDTTGIPCDDTLASTKSYRCFFRKHQFRRKLLVVGANDGMVHFFNSGIFDKTRLPAPGKYDNGTGHEVFAYMPRGVMPVVQAQATGTNHQYSVDGSFTIADVFMHPGHAGTPDPDKRVWRTVLFAGLREGGRSYYALDITQPDRLAAMTAEGDFFPEADNGWLPSCITSPDTSCGPASPAVPFGSAVWEFDDSLYDSVSGDFVQLDENSNGSPDLGYTWSTPSLGIIEVCASGDQCDTSASPGPPLVQKTVLVFGGGLDPANKSLQNPDYGNWLYMLDVETGDILYKRQLNGSVPSQPAAVDTDSDGILDRIYVGTTAGFLYRIDLTPDSSGLLPGMKSENVNGLDNNTYAVERINSNFWQPRLVFDTLAPRSDTDATLVRRPIYFRPSVLFVAKLGLYAVTFGVGDREDLWNLSLADGRFYTFVDDTNPSSAALTEGDLLLVDADDPTDQGLDLLLLRAAGEKGWSLSLSTDERVITDAFSLSGVTIFSSFVPRTDITGGGQGGCSSGFVDGSLCSRRGSSNIFVVNTTNADGFLYDELDNPSRYVTVDDFVTSPYSEQGQTKNPDVGGAPDFLTINQQRVMENLKSLYPEQCKFANFRIDIKTVAADTSVQHIAAVPVCMIEANWKEF